MTLFQINYVGYRVFMFPNKNIRLYILIERHVYVIYHIDKCRSYVHAWSEPGVRHNIKISSYQYMDNTRKGRLYIETEPWIYLSI